MKNLINIIVLVLFSTTSISYVQVGINTTTPNEDLHVVGDIQITDKRRLGVNTSTGTGDLGIDGQVLTSGGSVSSAKWTSLTTLSGVIWSSLNNIKFLILKKIRDS